MCLKPTKTYKEHRCHFPQKSPIGNQRKWWRCFFVLRAVVVAVVVLVAAALVVTLTVQRRKGNQKRHFAPKCLAKGAAGEISAGAKQEFLITDRGFGGVMLPKDALLI